VEGQQAARAEPQPADRERGAGSDRERREPDPARQRARPKRPSPIPASPAATVVPTVSSANTCTTGQGEIAKGSRGFVPVTLRSIASTRKATGRNQNRRAGHGRSSQRAASHGETTIAPTRPATASIVPDARQWNRFQATCVMPEPSA
jgi:hypothetical protein